MFLHTFFIISYLAGLFPLFYREKFEKLEAISFIKRSYCRNVLCQKVEVTLLKIVLWPNKRILFYYCIEKTALKVIWRLQKSGYDDFTYMTAILMVGTYKWRRSRSFNTCNDLQKLIYLHRKYLRIYSITE